MRKLAKNKTRIRKILILALVIFLFYGSFSPPFKNLITPVRAAYNVIEDNPVDADSTEDAQSNIGTDGATSYINAQSQNDDDQIIQEGNGAGYVAGNDVDETHDQVTNTQDPADVGIYSADSNMLVKDGTDNLLTEGQGAGYSAGDNNEDYVDTFVDTQSPTDVGSHTNSDNLKATDGTDDILEEAQGSGYVAGNDVEDFVDAVTNTQDPADLGSYSDWTEMQDQDGTYNTLTEENAGGVGGSEWLDCNAWDGTQDQVMTYVGADPYLNIQDQPTNYVWSLSNTAQTGWYDFPVTTLIGTITVNISIFCNNDDGPGDDRVDVVVDYTGSGSGSIVGTAGQHTAWQYDTISLGTHTVAEVNALRVQFDYVFSGGKDEVRFDHVRIGLSVAGGDNYRFDREFSWASLDYNEVDGEELCIYVNTAGSETLDIDIWESSAWTDIGTDIVDANDGVWVNISISAWLDSSTEYFRFEDATTSSDGSSDSWILDAVLIHVWTTQVDDYELELEFAFGTLDNDETNEELCIYTGTIGDEELDILVWTGSWTDIGTNILTTNDDTWINISISSWLDSTDEYFVFRGTSESGDGTPSTFGLDAVLIHSWTDPVDDYEFDREFAMTSIVTTDDTNEELTIFTGTCAPVGTAEKLDIYIWHSAAWVDIGDILATNDDTWINISIVTYLDASSEYFSLRDGDQALDSDSTTWEIDYVGIHTWTVEVLDYELDWEHQSQSVEKKDSYNLTIYGFSSDAETFSIWVWNASDTTWYDTEMDIDTTEQWYNFTFTSAYYGCNGSTITWNYRGDSESGDSTQTTLRIDYSGIRYWNFTINIIETTIINDDYKQGIGWELFDDVPFTINITSGVTYNIQIKGTDGSGSPIANEYLRFNTVNNPITGTNLTTSYITLYSDQTLGIENQHDLYVWCAVPFGVDDGVLTFTLYTQILES